jgi:hypothetical protein
MLDTDGKRIVELPAKEVCMIFAIGLAIIHCRSVLGDSGKS